MMDDNQKRKVIRKYRMECDVEKMHSYIPLISRGILVSFTNSIKTAKKKKEEKCMSDYQILKYLNDHCEGDISIEIIKLLEKFSEDRDLAPLIKGTDLPHVNSKILLLGILYICACYERPSSKWDPILEGESL
ncbi:MAG: hypothetical protein GY853_00840 [PVC group bacterium]|nr:hypothetical protein [PVC group bacterium]